MSTALATTDSGEQLAKGDIRSLLQSDHVRSQIELALPRHMSPDRMMRVALTAINKNPKLLDCTRESILLSLMTCSQYGVEPDGRHAHLIPYNNKKNGQWIMECQFQWDYKGLVAQIRKAPEVRDIYADIICENDVYKVSRGLHRDLVHEVDISKDRGATIAAYSVCLFKDGTASFELMSTAEIEDIRMRSKSTDKEKGTSTGPWLTDYFEMAKKTVVKRHSKWLPLPTEVSLAINADNEFDDLPTANAVEITKAQVPATSKPQATPALPEKTTTAATPIPQNEKVAVTKEPPKEKAAQATEVSSAPAETKGTPSKGKLVTKKTETVVEATAVDDSPRGQLVARTRAALQEAGHTEAQLIQVVITNEWDRFREFDPAQTKVSELADETLESFLDDWETVLAELQTIAQ